MDAPTKSVAKNRKSKSKKRTGSSSRPRQLTPQKNWARGLEMYNWLPESLLKKGGWMSHEEFSKYVKKATESKGFDVSGCTGRITNGIGEVRGEKLKAEAAEAANYAVAEHNTKTGANLNFVGMVKSNFTLAAVTVFYITLSALDEQNQPRVFHAKVLKDGRPGTTPEKKYTMRSFQPAPGQEVNG